ncbi:MAG: alpha/beta fold hydrolase [Trueperaceae bacterium]
MSRSVQLAPVRIVSPEPASGPPTTLRMAYERAGGGRPVLLIHGNFASRRWWTEQLDDPAPGLDLIAPDLPGFGRSDPLPDSLPEASWVAAWSDALAGLLDALGIERAGVVGHSLGGAAAQALAIRHPQRVSALLLVDAAPPGGFPTPEAHYPVLEAMKTDRNLLHASLAAISPTRIPPYFDALVDDAMAMQPRAFQGNARALAAYDLSADTGAVTAPVTVLHGAKDALVSRAVADATVAAYAGARLVAWPDVGHSPQLEAPEAFRDLLATTFARGPT